MGFDTWHIWSCHFLSIVKENLLYLLFSTSLKFFKMLLVQFNMIHCPSSFPKMFSVLMLHLPWYHAPWTTIYLIRKCLATSSYKTQSLRMLITSALSRTVSEWWFYPAFFIAVSYLLTLASTLHSTGAITNFPSLRKQGSF